MIAVNILGFFGYRAKGATGHSCGGNAPKEAEIIVNDVPEANPEVTQSTNVFKTLWKKLQTP